MLNQPYILLSIIWWSHVHNETTKLVCMRSYGRQKEEGRTDISQKKNDEKAAAVQVSVFKARRPIPPLFIISNLKL